jgi:hypothetical protein
MDALNLNGVITLMGHAQAHHQYVGHLEESSFRTHANLCKMADLLADRVRDGSLDSGVLTFFYELFPYMTPLVRFEEEKEPA